MTMLDILARKKTGQELTREEIAFFVKGAAEHTLPDYQLAAMLMAISSGVSARIGRPMGA